MYTYIFFNVLNCLFLEMIFDIIGISFAMFEFIFDYCLFFLFFFKRIMFRETKFRTV